MLHPDDIAYFVTLSEATTAAAAEHGIASFTIEAKRRPQTGAGVCYIKERRCSVAVRDKRCADMGGQWASRRYSDEYNIDTMAHEAAHLVHRGHGSEHAALTNRIGLSIVGLLTAQMPARQAA